jgi:G3E family GTPase
VKILLFGGFLGSGKTTIIRAFIDAIQTGELGTIAIIENEIGEVGIDDVLLRDSSVEVKPIFGGCVCCEITGSLIGAVDEIHKLIAPDWLIIELTGAAELENVKELLESFTSVKLEVAAISVVDGSRWERFSKIGGFFFEQILSGDIAILNKADLCPDPDATGQSIMELTGVPEIVHMSADRDRVADCAEILEAFYHLSGDQNAEGEHAHDDDHDHEHEHDDDDDHEHEHDHEHDDDHDHDDEHEHDHDDDHEHGSHEHTHDHEHERIVGAFSRSYTVRPEASADKAALAEKLSALFEEIGELLKQDGIIYGHVKGLLLESDDSYVRYSLTRPGRPEILMSGSWITSDVSGAITFTINVNDINHSEEEIAAMAGPCLKRYETMLD